MSVKKIENINKLIEEYRLGLSASELSKIYQTSTNVITNTLKRNGVNLRSLRESALIKLSKYGHPCLGRVHSEETRRLMSKNHADFSGEKHPEFKGTGAYAEDGTYLTRHHKGYLRRTVKDHPLAYRDGTIGEHVYQACLKYGVDFVKGKDVHHINAIKDDNSWDNLICITRSEHMRLEENLKKQKLSI